MADATKVGNVYLEIRAQINKLSKDLAAAHKETQEGAKKIQSSIDKINFDKVGASIDGFKSKLMGLFAGIGTVGIVKPILDVNASFERLQAKLDTLTPGKGKQTFDYLFTLVRDLPVGIETITQGFVTMTAMGLKPTEKQLLTLIDTASVLGEDVFGRVVLQLGQMTSKGKVMAQDLNILAEAGVNARKYIHESFGLTVEEIQDSGMDIQHVMEAIFEGMEVQFGGASKKMASTWDGVIAQMKKGWQELSIVIGDAGFFDAAKQSIRELTEELKILVKFASLRSVLETRAEGYKYVSKGILDKMNFEAADVYRKQEMVDWARKFESAGFDTKSDVAAIPVGYRSTLEKGIKDRRYLVGDSKAGKDGLEASRKEAEKLAEEIRKLEEEFQRSKLFSGENSNYERMQDQLRSGGKLTQMEAQRSETENKIWADAAAKENERLMDKVAEYEKTHKKMVDLSERTAEAMQDNFSSLFFDAMTGKLKTFEDYFQAVMNSIQRMVSDLAAQELTRGLFGPTMQGGGWLSGIAGLFGGGAANLPINQPGFAGAETFHSGGIVGRSGGAMRAIPASYYHSAPRLHNGLMPDEFPAILQRGERVTPKGRAGAMNNVTINVAAPNGRMDRESLSTLQNGLYAALSRQNRRNG